MPDSNEIQALTARAEAGVVAAQFNLGRAYYLGKGVEQDKDKAVEWWLKAAAQDDAQAQFNIGVVCSYGIGVAQDKAKAAEWWIKAAKQGHADAQFFLGVACSNGIGVVQDKAKAVEWWLKAAKQGHADAQLNLGIAYFEGEGIAQNQAEAVKWCRLSAEQGNTHAHTLLSAAYFEGKGTAQDQIKAVEWWHKIAEQGNAEAQFILGVAYDLGKAIVQDHAESVKWYRLSADQGHAKAQYNIGVAYYNGEGVEQDYAKAVEWWRKAAAQGHAEAQALVYIAEQIETNEGVNNKNHATVFQALFALYETVYRIRAELFCGQAESEVAHYTSLSAMQSLVAPKGRFRLCNAIHMDDPEEGKVFLQIMEKDYGIEKCQERYYPDLDPTSKVPVALSPAYIGSFVKAEDDGDGNKDRLYVWHTHGMDAGGACLIFGRTKFAEKSPPLLDGKAKSAKVLPRLETTPEVDNKQSLKPSSKPALYEIVYKSDCDAKLGGELKQLATALKGVETVLADIKPPDASADLRHLVRELLDSIRFLFKSNHYKWEEEMRVVEMHYGADSGDESDGRIKVDDRIPPRSYLELEMDFRCREIIFGSNVGRYREWELHLGRNAKDVTVSQSKIPLRR